ncbi:MAG: FxsA family protein [Nocardioidaceae bacterium]
MMRRLLFALLAVGVPAVEVFVIVVVAYAIGWWTLLLLIVSSAVGAWLVKRMAGRVWSRLREAMNAGELPEREVADAGAILLGGVLIAFPGFVTDVAGVVAVLPPTRPLMRRLLGRAVRSRLGGVMPFGNVGGGPSAPGGNPPGPVIQGRVVHHDEDEKDSA